VGPAEFACRACGRVHDAGQISFGADAPVQWLLISDGERARSELGGEQCVISAAGGHHFFVQACLEIPVKGAGRAFTWGVWVSLSEPSFRRWPTTGRTRSGRASGRTSAGCAPRSPSTRIRCSWRPGCTSAPSGSGPGSRVGGIGSPAGGRPARRRGPGADARNHHPRAPPLGRSAMSVAGFF